MNACKNEDDCPTPTRCRHLDRCPRAASEGITHDQGGTKVVAAVATGSAFDADRYRYLRSHWNDFTGTTWSDAEIPQSLDTAVDAAMAQSGGIRCSEGIAELIDDMQDRLLAAFAYSKDRDTSRRIDRALGTCRVLRKIVMPLPNAGNEPRSGRPTSQAESVE